MTESVSRIPFPLSYPRLNSFSVSSFVASFRPFLIPLLILVFLLVCVPVSESSIHPSVSYYFFPSASRVDASKSFAIHWKGRVARSPFMPPTVTSFQPPIRKSSNKQRDRELKVGESRVALSPPFIKSRSKSPQTGEKENENIPHHPPILPSKTTDESFSLPRPPMVMQQSQRTSSLNDDNLDEFFPDEEPILPQNDQHSLIVLKEESGLVFGERERTDAKDATVNQSRPLKTKQSEVISSFEKEPQEVKLTEFYQVLEAIGKGTKELQEILQSENISLDNFLDFIVEGTTKDEVLEFLRLAQFSKSIKYKNNSDERETSKINSFSKDENENETNKIDRKKLLMDLPFTEIVHEVPIESGKPFGNSFNGPAYKKKRQFSQDFQKDFNVNEKTVPKTWKKSRENNFKGKVYKPKRNKPKIRDEKPFRMNFDSASILLPKDSPAVMPFLPPKRKARKDKNSASIISLTIEEKGSRSKTKVESSTKLIPVRSKVLSGKEAGSKIHESDSSPSERRWKKNSSFEQQQQQQPQSNLRLVFPMKGILLFCGALGIFAFITIMILVIYGAVKCNRKPVSDTYQMNERRDVSNS